MKKTLIEVNYEEINNNSVLIFKDDKWTAVPKNAFLDSINEEIGLLKKALVEETKKRLEAEFLINLNVSALEKRIEILEGVDEPEPESEEEPVTEEPENEEPEGEENDEEE